GKDEDDTSNTALLRATSWQDDGAAGNEAEVGADDGAQKKVEKDAKFKAIAEALTREAGYRKVEYKGEGVFLIDYQISGKLTHAFLWPFNVDAEVIFPFVVV